MIKIREKSSSIVLCDYLELLGVAAQIAVELLRILGLLVILLLLVDHFLELAEANRAVSLAAVALDALVVEGVAAHEHDDGQGDGVLAALAILWVEVLRLSFQFLNLLAHCLNLLHVLIYLLAVLADHAVLHLKSIDEVVLDDAELELWLVLQNLEDEQRAENFVLLVLVLILIFFVAHRREGALQIDLVMRRRKVSEIGQSLNPELARSCLVCVCLHSVLLAHGHNLVSVILLDVVVKQLLLEAKALAAVLDSIGHPIYLEKEQHVVLIDLLVVPTDERRNLILESIWLAVISRRHSSLLLADLAAVEHVLQ